MGFQVPVHGALHAPRDVRSGPREISDLSFFEIFELPTTSATLLPRAGRVEVAEGALKGAERSEAPGRDRARRQNLATSAALGRRGEHEQVAEP